MSSEAILVGERISSKQRRAPPALLDSHLISYPQSVIVTPPPAPARTTCSSSSTTTTVPGIVISHIQASSQTKIATTDIEVGVGSGDQDNEVNVTKNGNSTASEEQIRVVIRFRANEVNEFNNVSIKDDGKSVSIRRIESVRMSQTMSRPTAPSSRETQHTQTKIKLFSFDAVTDSSAQKSFYEQYALDNVIDFVKGENSTIIAYGSTGSGKTFTITGNDEIEARILQQSRTKHTLGYFDENDFHGILPRSIETIFNELNLQQNNQYTIKCCYLEVYNEEVRDLLKKAKDPPKKIIMQECPKRGMIVLNIEEIEVRSYSDIFRCMRKGVKNRKIGVTQENHRSSRSHTLFILSLEQMIASKSSAPIISKLNIVDLAGSERLSSNEQQKMKETKNINKSLLSLIKCITHLSDPLCDRKHVPFRESKLTRLLKESLGGNSKTTVICTARLLESHIEETLRTLRFGRETQRISYKFLANGAGQNLMNENAHNDDLMTQIQYLKTANAELRAENIQLHREIRSKRGNHPAGLNTSNSQRILDNSMLTPVHQSENFQSFSEPKSTQQLFLQEQESQQEEQKYSVKDVKHPLKASDQNQQLRRRKTLLDSTSNKLSESFIARHTQLASSVSSATQVSKEEVMKWKTKYLNLKKESEEQIKQLQKQILMSKRNAVAASQQITSQSQTQIRSQTLLYNQLTETVRVLTQKFHDQENIIKNERASIKLSRTNISRASATVAPVATGSLSSSRSLSKSNKKLLVHSNSIGSNMSLQLPASSAAAASNNCEFCDKNKAKISSYETTLNQFESHQAKLLEENIKGKKVLADLQKRLTILLPEQNNTMNQQEFPANNNNNNNGKLPGFIAESAKGQVVAAASATPNGINLHDSISFQTYNVNSDTDSFSFSFDKGEDADFFEKIQNEMQKFQLQKAKIQKDIGHHKKRINEYSSLNQSMFLGSSTPPPNSGRTPIEQSSKSVKSIAENLQDFTSRLNALGPITPIPSTPKSFSKIKQKEATSQSLINKSYFSVSGPGYLDLNMSRFENSLYDDFELESINPDSSFRQNASYSRLGAPTPQFIDPLNGPSPIAQAKRFSFPDQPTQQNQVTDTRSSNIYQHRVPINKFNK